MKLLKIGNELVNVEEINNIYKEIMDNDEYYLVITTKNGLKHIVEDTSLENLISVLEKANVEILKVEKDVKKKDGK